MSRRQRTIRGVDDSAWDQLQEVRLTSRIQVGALVSDAIRCWYNSLEEVDEPQEEPVASPFPDLISHRRNSGLTEGVPGD